MKSKTFTWFTVMTLFAVLGMSIRVYAQEKQERDAQHHHYKLIDLGTFGGPNSGVNIEPFQNVINSKGTVVGGADTSMPTPEPGCYNPVGNPDCFISHAFVWKSNSLKDLGTLPGGNYSFAAAINDRGRIAGVSENDQIDPFTGNPEFHAVLWQNDQILDLGTLGGVSSFGAQRHSNVEQPRSGHWSGTQQTFPDPFFNVRNDRWDDFDADARVPVAGRQDAGFENAGWTGYLGGVCERPWPGRRNILHQLCHRPEHGDPARWRLPLGERQDEGPGQSRG